MRGQGGLLTPSCQIPGTLLGVGFWLCLLGGCCGVQTSGERSGKGGAQLGVKVLFCQGSGDCPTQREAPDCPDISSCGKVRFTHFSSSRKPWFPGMLFSVSFRSWRSRVINESKWFLWKKMEKNEGNQLSWESRIGKIRSEITVEFWSQLLFI